jgi:hypothetical protein
MAWLLLKVDEEFYLTLLPLLRVWGLLAVNGILEQCLVFKMIFG